MRFPDFYGIGVQKAGTTWLHAQLKQHPHIFMPPLKEIQYFNHLHIPEHRSWTDEHRLSRIKKMIQNSMEQEKVNYKWIEYLAKCGKNELNDTWYSHFFSMANERITGEITPEYSLLSKEGIEHMLQLNPDSKFILLLRHPVERDFSHAKMILDHRGELNSENDDVEDKLLEVLDYKGVYERSEYQRIIEQWEITLPNKANLYIGFYDWIKEKPQQLLEEVCTFIGTDYNEDYFKETDKVVFKGNSMKITEKTRSKLLEKHQGTINYINSRYSESHGIKW